MDFPRNELALFGANVFSDKVMKERLIPEVYCALRRTIDEGRELTIDVANAVADAMCAWALEKGATHYTHWFQPMTGSTAEKHDSFLDIPGLNAKPILHFSGKALIKGEADGSSFPSGGLRATFEARGYTTWDCTSPAFVKQDPNGMNVLCIPTAFCAFSGEALDEKTPLLRSMEAVNREAVRVLHLLGHEEVKHVTSTVGGEQEYFLIEKNQLAKRKDIVYTGRTLFGAPPAKGQELGDQYYATTPEGVACFMRELDAELWKLGVPAKTKHNEVAPSQYELAPLFASSNVACDHNQIIMEQMRRIADRHGYICLLHEKPFAGVNGSGKHNNWSLCTDTGINLLKPGKSEDASRIFYTFVIAAIAAVDEYSPLLRMSCATLGNQHRLGGHEAPPQIISIYTGTSLYEELCAFVSGEKRVHQPKETMNMGVSTLAPLYKDETDRNRTSPFAFTGDKFEFRMVGSSQSLGLPNTVLNTIAAEMLSRIADALEQAEDKNAALKDILGELLAEHERVIYNGNNYSEEWMQEAKERGLPIIDNTVDAIRVLTHPKAVEVFGKHGVLCETELRAREEVLLSNFAQVARIEATTMLKISKQTLLPAIVRYAGELARSFNAICDAGMCASAPKAMLESLTEGISTYYLVTDALACALERCDEKGELAEQAINFRENVIPAMERVRAAADALECIVDKAYWPMPSYGELLFHIV